MAIITIDGFSDLQLTFEQMARLPDSVKGEMLNAEADVITEAQKAEGAAMGVHRTGVTLGSIKKTKLRKNSISVEPTGTNADGTRNAEVAFINNYGKKGQPARPFIDAANEKKADEAVEKAAEVYGKWLDSL